MASTTPIAILSSLLLQTVTYIKMTLTYNDIMTTYFMTKQQPELHRDQDPGATQPEGNCTHLNYKFFFFFFLDTQIFPVLVVNSLCKNIFLIFFSKFPVFSLSGKMDFQIPCFPCAVATLMLHVTKMC